MDKLTALVVEDDADIAIIFGRALRAAGFEVKIACTGRQALTMLSAIVPTLVFLDIALPEVSGIDILESIRSDPRLSKTYVVITTAYSRLAQKVKDKADLVLLKPIPYAQLCDLSRRLATTAT